MCKCSNTDVLVSSTGVPVHSAGVPACGRGEHV